MAIVSKAATLNRPASSEYAYGHIEATSTTDLTGGDIGVVTAGSDIEICDVLYQIPAGCTLTPTLYPFGSSPAVAVTPIAGPASGAISTLIGRCMRAGGTITLATAGGANGVKAIDVIAKGAP